jgi:hypothetical protein
MFRIIPEPRAVKRDSAARAGRETKLEGASMAFVV